MIVMADGESPHPHKLFVFMTQKLGSYFRITQRKEWSKWRVMMRIYGDPGRNQSAIDENVDVARDICVRTYITFLLKEDIKKLDYLPGREFGRYQMLIKENLPLDIDSLVLPYLTSNTSSS
jgi:hypothetical protein